MNILLPAEWSEQKFVQLTWPHENTDWASMLKEVSTCFVNIALEIIKREKLLIVCRNAESVKSDFEEDFDFSRIHFVELKTNDT